MNSFSCFQILKKIFILLIFIILFSCEKQKCYECEIITTSSMCTLMNGVFELTGPQYVKQCGTDAEIDAWEQSVRFNEITVPSCPYQMHIIRKSANCHNN